MAGQQWRVRVASEDDKEVIGAGFLLDATHVMTCAHVVGDRWAVVVTFPDIAEISAVPATVEFRGPWTAGNDYGDIAVLRLKFAVTVEAACFAWLHALKERRFDQVRGELELHVYGFPRGYDQEGADTRVIAPYLSPHMGEWAQLEAIGVPGIRLQSGFSGAAVTFADTGEVVGMMVGADKDKQTKIGKMLSLHRMCHYWKPLADLLAPGPLPSGAWSELRELLAKVSLDLPVARLYVASLPDGLGPAAPHFTSLWDAARFVANEVVTAGDQPLARFCAAVADYVGDRSLRADLDDWRERYFPGAAARASSDTAGPAAARQASVVVRLMRSGDPSALTLTMATIVDSVATPVYQGRIRAGQVRSQVERKVPDAFRQVPPDLDVMIEFELPRSWLNKPVDEWHADPRERCPLGWSYPVVVRELSPVGKSDRPRRVGKRWQTLLAQPTPLLHPIDCRDTRDRLTFTAWLFASTDRTVLALANPPRSPDKHAALRAALYAGIPVMLWSRQHCVGPHTGTNVCAGDRFLLALRQALADVHPAELPQVVRTLRAKAVCSDNDEHCGRALTLFWDDPRRQDLDVPLELAD